ncbi:MAG: hypothetical protein HC904_04600 [Blastochloris sp.]|nr:hypothetical protein [Blastochloris sp.]
MRFMEQYIKPKLMLQSPEFGGLCSVSVTAGNFGLAMNGTHYFEMFRYLTDEPAVEVQAWFSEETVPNPRGPQFLDRAGTIRLTTATGKRFYLDASADQGHGVFVQYVAKYGQITVDELGGRMSWSVRKSEQRDMPTTRYGMPWTEGLEVITPADALKPSLEVLNALLEGGNYPTGEDGLLAIKVLVAAYVSSEQGSRVVRLDEKFSEEQVFPWA